MSSPLQGIRPHTRFPLRLIMLAVLTVALFTRGTHALPTCTRMFCAANGGRALCAVATTNCTRNTSSSKPSKSVQKDVTLPCKTPATMACALWQDDEDCDKMSCPTECMPFAQRPVGSDGMAYCTLCSLRRRSCQTRYSMVGPLAFGAGLATVMEDGTPLPTMTPSATMTPLATITPSVTMMFSPTMTTTPRTGDGDMDAEGEEEAETSSAATVLPSFAPLLKECETARRPAMRAMCCAAYDMGCIGPGQACMQTSTRPYVRCSRGLSCVGTRIEKNEMYGECVGVYEKGVAMCSVDACGRLGKDGLCKLADRLEISTCSAWAKRKDGGYQPNCNRVCERFCEMGRARPRGSDGRQFCSVCELLVDSCERGFEVWGPVVVSESVGGSGRRR